MGGFACCWCVGDERNYGNERYLVQRKQTISLQIFHCFRTTTLTQIEYMNPKHFFLLTPLIARLILFVSVLACTPLNLYIYM